MKEKRPAHLPGGGDSANPVWASAQNPTTLPAQQGIINIHQLKGELPKLLLRAQAQQRVWKKTPQDRDTCVCRNCCRQLRTSCFTTVSSDTEAVWSSWGHGCYSALRLCQHNYSGRSALVQTSPNISAGKQFIATKQHRRNLYNNADFRQGKGPGHSRPARHH